MYFGTICCLTRQVVLFLLLCMGMLKKGLNAKSFAVSKGAN
jgi:hypothetical protein